MEITAKWNPISKYENTANEIIIPLPIDIESDEASVNIFKQKIEVYCGQREPFVFVLNSCTYFRMYVCVGTCI